jgi:hypothetical protein
MSEFFRDIEIVGDELEEQDACLYPVDMTFVRGTVTIDESSEVAESDLIDF